VGELALATVLMVSAALLARSLSALNRVEVGFDPERLLVVSPVVAWQRFTGDSTVKQVDAFYQRLVDAVAASPAVAAVAVTNNAPLTGDRGNNTVLPEGWTAGEENALYAERRFVSVNFFEVTRTPIVDGRPFEAGDDRPAELRSIIISEGLARRVWPGESAVGRRLSFWGTIHGTVVGVAANVRDETLETETAFAFYVPLRQMDAQAGKMLIRTRSDPAAAAAEVRARLQAAAPDVPVSYVTPMTALMEDTLVQQRFRTRLMTTFAGLAALFALLGIYGVTARAVAQRTRELAIRMALGAERRAVLALVLRQGARLALGGAAIGLGLALVAGRLVRELLYGVTATDPVALGGIALLVAGASVAAGWFPARRATRVEPMDALRAE
jgi:predicted permease